MHGCTWPCHMGSLVVDPTGDRPAAFGDPTGGAVDGRTPGCSLLWVVAVVAVIMAQ